MILLTVLVVLLVVTGSSVSLIWFMNQQQARAGARYHSVAALAVAEAGVHRALAALETVAPDDRTSGRHWRPAAYSEGLQFGGIQGRFTISLADRAGGVVVVDSAGVVPGATRHLRARVQLAAPALLTALHGTGFVRLERPPAAITIVPYSARTPDRSWVHIAAGRGIWFATTDVSINDRRAGLGLGPGPMDIAARDAGAGAQPEPGPVRMLLARGASLVLGSSQERVDVQPLRAMGIRVEGVIQYADALPALPDVDLDALRTLAAANRANAALNHAAGEFFADTSLARKRDSLYSALEFQQIQEYLKSGLRPPRFEGVIHVAGEVALLDDERLTIADGSLIAEGAVHLGRGAALEITHTAATRALPGLIVTENGALIVGPLARLRVHGLVYVNRAVEVGEGARVDVVGSVLANDPGLSFRNIAATVVIRYDPAVLGTQGVRAGPDARVTAWVTSWEEMP
jgi:hypothetical protein